MLLFHHLVRMIAEFIAFLAKYNIIGMAVGLLIAGKV